ncbi:Endonuclease/exonuclease/phosphatase [Suillus subalutaceus]|uniref:Endonuclease/exonuclease/phosphatase n=1 Tax=Suillus subalutaceus TaxID=48586 RepID=UPI001B85F491|nr:Endonuclease/exonuclease/phosphatase [Suillus subalutaceus]KAG1859327.1 Endonuclease/exonuclease/phosphatase [Suillus subalutaceus]
MQAPLPKQASALEHPTQPPTPVNQWQYLQSDSASTTEISVNGVRTLDSGYKIMATPAGGFPIPQLGQSTWCNVSQVLKKQWPQKEGAKAWVCSSADVSCFFVPFEQPLPIYMFTLENFSFPDSDATNRDIAEIIKDTIHSNPDVMQFIHDNIPLPDAEAALRTIELVRVSSISLALSKSVKETVWNIYFDSPPAFTLKQYFDWTTLMRTFFYISKDYGYGTAHQDAQFVCMGCKSFNHPTGLCPFPKIPGWFGPSVTEDKDTSNVTLDNHIMTSHGKGALSGSSTRGNRGFTRGHTCGHTRRGRGKADDTHLNKEHTAQHNRITQNAEPTSSQAPPNAASATPPDVLDSPSGPVPNLHPKHCSKGKKSCANIKVATLNMRGRWHNSSDKWSHVNQIMKDQKLGILALQETHLTKEEESALNLMPGLRLCVISSIDPAHTNAKGVAIAINKNLMNTSGIKIHELVPGRALFVIIPWQKNNTFKILAVYAPNNPQNNQYFWEHILSKLRGLPNPDIMLRDFNMVEDALDRLLPKQDSSGSTSKLNDLKTHLKLRDGWQLEHPDTLQYTFAQSAHQGGCQSRIDRIYVKDELLPFSRDWDITPLDCTLITN